MTPFSRAHPLLSMLRAFTLRISQVTTQFYFFVHMLPLFTASHSLVAGRPASGCHLLLASSQGKVGSRNTETLAGLNPRTYLPTAPSPNTIPLRFGSPGVNRGGDTQAPLHAGLDPTCVVLLGFC